MIAKALPVFLISAVAQNVAFADDETVQKGLQDAKAEFEKRSATNPQPIDKAIAILNGLEGQADDSDLNYDVLILESRAIYWKGEHTADDTQRANIHADGQVKADAAKKVNDAYAEAYYYAGINLARWAEAKGILESLGRKDELVAYMNQTLNHNTRDDKSGETIDGYGPNRVFGRMYFKLPVIFGGSIEQSKKYLKKGFENAKDLALNVVYYAETLNSSSDTSEQALAKKILDEMLAIDENSYNPSRLPENHEEFELGRKLRAQMH